MRPLYDYECPFACTCIQTRKLPIQYAGSCIDFITAFDRSYVPQSGFSNIASFKHCVSFEVIARQPSPVEAAGAVSFFFADLLTRIVMFISFSNADYTKFTPLKRVYSRG